jgi:hypothetical protein
VQRQQDHHRPGRLTPPAVQIVPQLLDLAAWTFGGHADRAHTDHDLAGGRTLSATSIQPPARLLSTPFTHRSHSGSQGLIQGAAVASISSGE